MKKIVFVLLASLSFAHAQGQESTLLQKYRAMALEYNHDLKAAEKNISASIELQKSAKADRKPKIGANANFQYTGNPMELILDIPTMTTPLSFRGTDMNYGASLSLLQPVYAGGKILENIRMAGHQQAYAVNQKELVRSSVCFQTDIQYWNTVARAEMLTIATEFCNSVTSLTNVIRERVEVGVTDPQDLLMAEVKLNEAKYQLLQAQNGFSTGVMALNSLIGVDLTTSTEIDTRLPTAVNTDSIPTHNGEARPEVRMAQSSVSMQESALKLNDAQYKPQLYVGAEGSYSSPGYNFKPNMDPNYAVYAKLSIPIFEWGKRRSDKRAGEYRIGMATDNLNKVTDAVLLEVQMAQLNLTQAEQRTMLAQNSLAKADENEEKAIERYNEGKASIVDVIEAQVYKQTSQINFVQAKLAMQNSYSELLRVLNVYNLQ